MYFSGTLAIDPSQLTHLELERPKDFFGQFVQKITAGLASKKYELETFTAVSVLQQINYACQNLGINNIVRLAKDDLDIYVDMKGKKDDLLEVTEKFRLETDRYEAELFDTLFLVLEHEQDGIKYLIEVDIKRRHKVGEYPIAIKVNGVLADFSKGEVNKDTVAEKMKPIFSSQEKYDGFLMEKQATFNQFVHQFAQSLQRGIRVDDIKTTASMKMIRPKKRIEKPEDVPQGQRNEPAFYGYPGFAEVFFYAWMWSSFAHMGGIHCHNFDLVDEAGATMMSVGDAGFDAGATDTLNPDSAFEMPENMSDVDVFSGHEFEGDMAESGMDFSTEGMDVSSVAEDGGSWLDSLSEGFDLSDFGIG